MTFQKPRGTRDFFPEDIEQRLMLFNLFRNIAKSYNFSEVESPAFENMSLLTAKSGSEIIEQVFGLEKRGKEKFGLRFDLTVPLTRMFIEKQKSIPKPVKWFYVTRMWRYEAPQKGRLREFYQMGVELFGSDKANADAEIISLAIDCLTALGLTKKDFVVELNNRRLLEGLLIAIGIKEQLEEVIRIIDKSKKITENEFYDELQKLKLDKTKINKIKKLIKIKDLNEIKKFTLNEESKKGLEELNDVLDDLKNYEKEQFIEVDLSTARGLAYYTGTVFECFDRNGKLRSIFAGGRYDKMVKQFGGSECPATGFSIGDVTLQLLLEEKNLWPKVELGPDYFIAVVNEDVKEKAIEIAQKLRKNNKVEINLVKRNLGKQFEYANAIKAKKVVIVGPDELKEGKVKVKDMKTGKQGSTDIEQLH